MYFMASTLWADELPEWRGHYVDDRAGVLSEDQRHELEQPLISLARETSTQIFAVILPSIDSRTYLEKFSADLFRQWGPGRAAQDNGVLVVVLVRDRRMRIEVGYGLEDVLTDVQSAAIIRNEFAPGFQRQDYFSGLQKGLLAIRLAVQGRYQMPVNAPHEEGEGPDWIFYFFLLIVIIVIMRSRRRYSETYSRGGSRRHPWDGPIIWGGGRGGGRSSGWGGGGFGGMGGMSGGGGASGGW